MSPKRLERIFDQAYCGLAIPGYTDGFKDRIPKPQQDNPNLPTLLLPQSRITVAFEGRAIAWL